MTNNTNDKVNLIKGRVITWKHIKSKQDTNQHFNNKVWKRIHNMEGKQLKQRITELEDEDITKENKEEKDCLKCKYLREIQEASICGTNLTKTHICLKSKHEDKESDENHYCDAYEERRGKLND